MGTMMKQSDLFETTDLFNAAIKNKYQKKVKKVPRFMNSGITPCYILCDCTDCGYFTRYCKCLVDEGSQIDVSTEEKLHDFLILRKAT